MNCRFERHANIKFQISKNTFKVADGYTCRYCERALDKWGVFIEKHNMQSHAEDHALDASGKPKKT